MLTDYSELKAVIFGVAGTSLSAEEKKFFRTTNPVGFILFKRNCENPKQIKSLIEEIRECVGWHAPVLIDQEGGRVARLGPPHWRKSPPAGLFADIAKKNLTQAGQAVYLNARLIAAELTSLGINVNCAPMADILYKTSHNIIGDRAFGSKAKIVSTLAGDMARGLMDGGVIPVLKHIPGHGRAVCDSHESLPLVDASKEELEKTDFLPFKKLRHLPWGMTAHITYTSIDRKNPATLSKKIISIIRDEIGFEGLLLTDDLSMKALSGSLAELTKKSLAAGCDIALHCNGKMDEMKQIARACPKISKKSRERLEKSLKLLKSPPKIDFKKAQSELEELVA